MDFVSSSELLVCPSLNFVALLQSQPSHLIAFSESEVRRQIILLDEGKLVEQATRGYDALTGETFHLRSKEDAPDYRYMPDPELGAIVLTEVSSFVRPGLGSVERR